MRISSVIFFRRIPEPSIFERMQMVLKSTMVKNSLKNLEGNCEKIGEVRQRESYGVWTLLNNKNLLTSMTGVAGCRTKVSFFKRKHFFEALEMGLTSKRPEILNIMWNLPVFSEIPRFQILGNISKLELFEMKYGDVLTEEGLEGDAVYILKSGSLDVRDNFPIFSTIILPYLS